MTADFTLYPWRRTRPLFEDIALLRHALQLALQPMDLGSMIVIAGHGGRLAVALPPLLEFSAHSGSYPAARKKFWHSFGVKQSMRRPTASHRPATERSAALRRSALSFENAFSMGLKSGCRAGDKADWRRQPRWRRGPEAPCGSRD